MQIPLFQIFWDDGDFEEIRDIIRRGMFWTTGPDVERFEKAICDYIGAGYCTTFNSGTSALHAGLLAHGIGAGDEVIVPSFTFVATANAPLMVGAKPVFADIKKGDLGLDPEDVQKKITRNTKAIIPVHYGGCPCSIEAMREIATDHHLLLFEDAAEAFGARVQGTGVGTFGDLTMFSFCQNKIITTGEGGAVVTDSEDIDRRLRLIRSHGRQEQGNYFSTAKCADYVSLGFNFRMPDILAGLGLSQLKKIDKIIEMRRYCAECYRRELSGVSYIKIPDVPLGNFSVYQLFSVMIHGTGVARDDVIKRLEDSGIASKVYFSPVHLTRYYRDIFGYTGGELPVTEEISGKILSLPMYPTLQRHEIAYITRVLRDLA